MKRNTKGFTLVELLAVIVILAIIALITVPAILNLINEAREKGAQDKAWGTIDAVRLAFARSQGGFSQSQENAFADSSTYEYLFKGSNDVSVGGETVRISGERPVDGTVTINVTTGQITCNNLSFVKNGTYSCTTTDGNEMDCKPATCTKDASGQYTCHANS